MRANNVRPFLQALNTAADGQDARVVDHVTLGASKRIKDWPSKPNEDERRLGYDQWHLYALDRMAPGYFIHNLLLCVSKKLNAQRENAWFPMDGKEARLEGRYQFERTAQQTATRDRVRKRGA